MIAVITIGETTDSPANVAHRDDCTTKPKGLGVDMILEPGANFLTIADTSGPPFNGRTIHLVPCPKCIGSLDEPIDPDDLDQGTKAVKGLKAGAFK